MIRTLVVAAGLAVGATSAQAAVLGVRIIEGDSAGAAAALGQAATVLRIYAIFDGPGQVDALPNNAANHVLSMTRLNIDVKGAGNTFFQASPPFGVNTIAPDPGFFGFDSTLPFDTYGTIGFDPNEGVDPRRATISIEGGSTFENSTSIRGEVFNSTPPNGLGVARNTGGLENAVFLWQLTILGTQGDGTFDSFGASPGEGSATVVFGTPEVDLSVNAGGLLQGGFSFGTRSNPVPFLFNVAFTQGDDPVIPTPGAIALFGLAGLSAARRRR